jgi:hypothetical protein
MALAYRGELVGEERLGVQIHPGGGRLGGAFGVNGVNTFPELLHPLVADNLTLKFFAFVLGVPLELDFANRF